MNYIIFSEEIEFESVNNFIEKTRGMRGESITIYLYSGGGSTFAAYILLDYINKWEKDVTIIATGEVNSCALYIFLLSNSKKIVKARIATHHIIFQTLETRDIQTSHKDMKIMLKDLDLKNKEYFKLLDMLEVPEDIKAEIKNGEDVYIDKKELEREASIAERLFYKKKE